MHPEEHFDTISAALEHSCAQEAIHLLGVVQSYGFLMAIDIPSRAIVQVSSGITRHWPELATADALIGAPLADWVALVEPPPAAGPPAPHDGRDAGDACQTPDPAPAPEPHQTRNPAQALDLASLPESHTVMLPWRPRFEATQGALPELVLWECLGHRRGDIAVLEWLPAETCADETRRQCDMFAGFVDTLKQLRHASDLDAFFGESVRVIQQLSAFDRVMLYRFLPDGAGEIVAEHTDTRYQRKYLGLRFPASDIPSQARSLFLLNRLRVLADVEAPMDSLLPPMLPNGVQLDQSHCLLRGLSQVHLSYLRNMGVRATLTLSIVCDGKLWGLVACHHHQPRTPPYHIKEGMRQLCELLAEVIAMRVGTLTDLQTMTRRVALDRLMNQFHQALIADDDILISLEAWMPSLLAALGADNFSVRIGTLAYIGGPGRQAACMHPVLDEVAARMDLQVHTPLVQTWDKLLAPGTAGLQSLPEAAGLMLAQRHEDDMLFCFVTRPEVVQQVRWGGEPLKDVVSLPDGQVRLEPRRSFAEWQQSVRGCSSPWAPMEADALQSLLQILGVMHRLQVNRKLHDTLQWRAHHDYLTGLYNRRAMEAEVSRRLEDGQFNTALMLLDIDHFKKINDTYGHDAGDLVLQQLSSRLKAVMRGMDLLARLGGDEFMLLLQILRPNSGSVLTLAERLHKAVLAPFDVNGKQLRVAISVGIAIPPGHGRTVGQLLRHADLALYEAKSLGRSRSVVFEMAMASDQRDAYLLECDLSEAVERDQLSLVYQPKVDLSSRKVIGVEALVRWNHPLRGQNGAAAFIPMAERSDEIIRIDRWVMRRAVTDQAGWRTQGLAALPVAVNLSIVDILSPNLENYLHDLLLEFQVPAHGPEIEVTESCIMGELGQTQGVLRNLNNIGISTTLDDFGTGFSSLSHLRQLPLQTLKIDQSFIEHMLGDPHAEKLTQAIVAMGIALHMMIVAEGIETAEQMQWLLAHGCHIGQGYYFSPPVPGDTLHQVIERIELRLNA